MRIAIVICGLLWGSSAFSQHTVQVWTEVGAKGFFKKDWKWSIELNNRFDNTGHSVFFPQISTEYELKKWLSLQLDYRFSEAKDQFTNYQPENRFMLNVNAEHNYKRLEYGMRIRYQYEYARWTNTSGFEQKTSSALRFKPGVKYDIDNSIFSPYFDTELFFSTERFNGGMYRWRFGAGIDFELDGPHGVSVGYIYDWEFNKFNRHVVTASYKYKFSRKKKKK